MRLRADDPFVRKLADDIESLIVDGARGTGAESVRTRLFDLAIRQSAEVKRYWAKRTTGLGIPSSAFRGAGLWYFPELEPARVFRTSGTTGTTRGVAAYSARGAELLDAAIVEHARRRLGEGPFNVIRLVPEPEAVPDVVMAYGMAKIASVIGAKGLGGTSFIGRQLDIPRLVALLGRAVAEQVPTLVVGGTFSLVHACDALSERGTRFELPPGSIVLDAGGFKNRSRVLAVAEYERMVTDRFGAVRFMNLFGMTELASQLYDAGPAAIGPRGERAKASNAWVTPIVRDPMTLSQRSSGLGLLEICDLAILDRPCVILSDDVGQAAVGGVAVVGRAVGSPTRGCTLHIEELATSHDSTGGAR
jgi:hypothetical protein